MFLLNLSVAEFLAIFSAVSTAVVALYLLDRSRRRVIAATLKFWTEAERPVESTRRRRIRQWPSLLLTLLSLVCLLLAIAQLRLGSRDDPSRDHVLILDTSSWMAARNGGAPILLQAQRQALAYVRAVPSTDRVMLVYADALATPATPFVSDRLALERAIRAARHSSAALDLGQAFDFAQNAMRRNARRAGEIAFAGAGRVAQADGASAIAAPANLRVLPVASPAENVGLRKIGLRRSTADREVWQVLVAVRNYGSRPRQADLAVQFAGAPAGSRRFQLAPGSEQETVFDLRTQAAGILEARLRATGDPFPADDEAKIELPQLNTVAVTVCTGEPAALRPLLESHPNVRARYATPEACPAEIKEGIAIYDRYAPARPPAVPAIYIEPPAERSPVRVAKAAGAAHVQSWLSSHPVASGVRAPDLRIDSTLVFAPGQGDARIAESAEGPVIVAREQGRMVAFGFHPTRGNLRFELAVPLLFANVLRWMAPESFRRWELYAESVGTVTVPLESAEASRVRITGEDGSLIPFSIHENSLRFFSRSAGTVRIATPAGEQVHSLVLPDVPERLWEPPRTARRGIPAAREAVTLSRDIWHWLAIAGGLGLLAEWLLFSPASPRRRTAPVPSRGRQEQVEADRMRRAS